MRSRTSFGPVIAIVGALAAMPAAAADPAPAQKPGYDPNERICRNITLTGSRLATKRVCATRSQWEERLRLDREAVEQVQRAANPPCSTVNTRTGAPSC